MELIFFLLYVGCVLSTLYVIGKRGQLGLFLGIWALLCWPAALVFAALLPREPVEAEIEVAVDDFTLPANPKLSEAEKARLAKHRSLYNPPIRW